MEVGHDARPGRTAPLIPRRRRLSTVPVVVVGVVVVGVLSARYAGDGEAGRVDRALARLVPMNHGFPAVAGEALADLGEPIPVAVLLVLLAGAAWWWRGGRGLALALLGPGTAMVTTSLVLKPMVGRTRGGSLAFPSGHATAVAAVVAVAVILVLSAPAVAGRLRGLVAVGLALLALVVGVCLVGRDYHYPTDVLGALGVVAMMVPLAALAVDAFADLGQDGGGPLAPEEEPTTRLPVVR